METDRFQVLCLKGTVIGIEGTYIHVTLCIGHGKQLAFYSECHGKLMDGYEQEVM